MELDFHDTPTINHEKRQNSLLDFPIKNAI